jgi:DNA modification methylase
MKNYSSAEVASKAGVHKDTLLRWLRQGLVPEPRRDRHGWRIFTEEEALWVEEFAKQEYQADFADNQSIKFDLPYSPIEKLKVIDWDFRDAETGYLTHSLHPYPAKFIPQIPNALIQELSSVGETVLDIFCGSGTTLVEALLLKRNCIGIDANPLGCLISKAKTALISEQDMEFLHKLEDQLLRLLENYSLNQYPLFHHEDLPNIAIPRHDKIGFWFKSLVAQELAIIKFLCNQLPLENSRNLALAVFSSIIVSVSKQDSDTRYVRREKNIQRGETLRKFIRAFNLAIKKAQEFSEIVEHRFSVKVINANILDHPDIGGSVDLMVCSPPYPNAYSYHLYHMTRMLWLDMDQPAFKKQEIGSHRKYSRKGINKATISTFNSELNDILLWLKSVLKLDGYACFVIGDSILDGELIQNDKHLIEVARHNGYIVEANFSRNINIEKKSFNPAIGKIRHEHIVILRNKGD